MTELGRITPQPEGPTEADDYEIGQKLGEGGMAVTYLARQRKGSIDQLYALKALKTDGGGDDSLFRREAQIVAGLRHSNIVVLKDIDLPRRRLLFELIDGVDLRALINSVEEHCLRPHLVIYIVTELSKALAYAHDHERPDGSIGIVHRDISAGNVMVSLHGEVKLADFGIAAAIRREGEPHSKTVRGKVCYMAPEQALGLPLDGRCDLFSLGVLCFELLTGERPFDADTDAQTLVRAARGQRARVTDLAPETPSQLVAIVDKLLQADRTKRFGNADELFDALSDLAPPPNVCRELGYLVMSARGLVADGSHSGVVPKPFVRTRPQSTTVRVTKRRVLLGAGLLALTTGTAVWGLIGRAPTAAEQPSIAPEHDLPVASTSSAAAPAPLAPTEPVVFEKREDVPHDEPSAPPPGDVDEEVHLQVGSVPLSRIWLDGRMVGWAPVKDLRVSPGEHVFGAGDDAPLVTRKILIRRGARPDPILLRLKK